MADVKWT